MIPEKNERLNNHSIQNEKVQPKDTDAPTHKRTHRLFVDMDGTLAEFKPTNKIETLYEKGYFRNLRPIPNAVEAVKSIIEKHPDVQVFVLSAVLSDSEYAIEEKNAWIDHYLPDIDMQHRIFPPCGCDKKDYIPNGVTNMDFLLDDYSKNLMQWEPPAKGIKFMNGINGTNGTWQREKVNFYSQNLADEIMNIIEPDNSKSFVFEHALNNEMER